MVRLLSTLESAVQTAAQWCLQGFESGNKLLVLGNGGSACEAQHLVSELMGRYLSNRRPLPAAALTADTAVLTCIGNDFSYEEVLARQIQAFGRPGDLLTAFSTTGHSPNVLRAIETARALGLRSITFLGRDGGASAALSDCALIAPYHATARIQEAHNFLMHAFMDIIERHVGVH